MKHYTLALMLAIVALGATFYADEGLTHDGQHYNVTVGADEESAVLIGEHYSVVLRLDDCNDKDVYVFCLDNLTRDVVEHYPHEYELTVSISKPCSDCSAYGQSCEEKIECSRYCVHGVCRPQDPWCGDGYCDEGEACSADCENETAQEPAAEPEENVSESEEDANTTAPAVNETNTTAPEQVANASADEPKEESTLEASAAPAAEDDANWAAGAAILVFGIVALVFVFRRHGK